MFFATDICRYFYLRTILIKKLEVVNWYIGHLGCAGGKTLLSKPQTIQPFFPRQLLQATRETSRDLLFVLAKCMRTSRKQYV